jgi:hypothetical protein
LGIIALILILQLGKYFRTPTPPQNSSVYQPLTEIPVTAQKVTVGVYAQNIIDQWFLIANIIILSGGMIMFLLF